MKLAAAAGLGRAARLTMETYYHGRQSTHRSIDTREHTHFCVDGLTFTDDPTFNHRRIKRGGKGAMPPNLAPTSSRRGYLAPLECKKTF